MYARHVRHLLLVAVSWAVSCAVFSCANPPATPIEVAGPSDASIVTPEASTYSENAGSLFDEAQANFARQDYARAEPLFREVMRKYAYSRWAPKAEMKIADIRFAQGQWLDAQTAYEKWIHDHRSDEEMTRWALDRIEQIKKRDAG
jgi:outer membrane protein assembly factor BamD (BamD/ComL family)